MHSCGRAGSHSVKLLHCAAQHQFKALLSHQSQVLGSAGISHYNFHLQILAVTSVRVNTNLNMATDKSFAINPPCYHRLNSILGLKSMEITFTPMLIPNYHPVTLNYSLFMVTTVYITASQLSSFSGYPKIIFDMYLVWSTRFTIGDIAQALCETHKMAKEKLLTK